jgi:hypothetical protein
MLNRNSKPLCCSKCSINHPVQNYREKGREYPQSLGTSLEGQRIFC